MDFPKTSERPAELSTPERIADDGDVIFSGLIFTGVEGAPELWLHAQHLEKIGLRAVYGNGFGPTGIARVRCAFPGIKAHRFQRVILRLPVQIIGSGQRKISRRAFGLPKRYQAPRLVKWQWPQHDGIDYRENGSVRADPQRQSNHGERGEARTFRQHADSVANVLE